MSAAIRVLVIEDSQFMRNALARRIASDPRFQVIDTAENGQQGVEKAMLLKPDVITLDVEMPVMNGIDALKRIVAQSTIPVVMLSAVTDEGAKVTLEALEIGAVDFVPKSKGAELIHEKLIAAVGANMRSRGSMRAPALSASVTKAAAPATQSRPGTKIVIIGSSTGGPQALQHVIGQLPANLPVPVLVAQHMPPNFTAALASRLDETCKPKVVEAKDGDVPQKGMVYVAPGGQHMRITTKGIRIAPDAGESLYRPSVDVLAQSALATYGKGVVGVMLTGMGNDGAREFARLRQAGAYNIAQDQSSCIVFGMPRSVIESGGADEVLPLDRIGERLKTLLSV